MQASEEEEEEEFAEGETSVKCDSETVDIWEEMGEGPVMRNKPEEKKVDATKLD